MSAAQVSPGHLHRVGSLFDHDRARYNARMYTPQAGIFALGTSSHAYLEFDLLDATKRKQFVSTISAIREPRTTTGGVNFVIGFRPELWRDVVPDDIPVGVEGFNKEITGTEGFVMPSTQHDSLVWLSGSAYDVIFDMARSVIRDLAGLASLGEETSSWSYQHDRDLTGFIDGSENPTLLDAPMYALVPEGAPGAALAREAVADGHGERLAGHLEAELSAVAGGLARGHRGSGPRARARGRARTAPLPRSRSSPRRTPPPRGSPAHSAGGDSPAPPLRSGRTRRACARAST